MVAKGEAETNLDRRGPIPFMAEPGKVGDQSERLRNGPPVASLSRSECIRKARVLARYESDSDDVQTVLASHGPLVLVCQPQRREYGLGQG